ncbi:MAG: zinc metallopeptidase [Chthoniobacterales bacterium]|nr:zinc metallopeptidase [Chthoniobacterales bacterium]
MTTTALLLFAGTMLLSLWASARVKRTYRRYSAQPALSGLTGAETARRILENEGVVNVEVVPQQGELTDHYDPLHRRLVLSEENFHGNSVAAVAVSAHEAGHAIQHARAYGPLHLRMAAVGATQFASQIVMWLPLLGLFTSVISPTTAIMLMAGGWGIIMFFNLVTLPVEFDASRRARLALRSSGAIATVSESEGVDRVLNAAALTYVAAFITSLAYFLWHLLPLLAGRRE